jgi:Fe-S-cluster-containing dehydrogenase component
VRKWNLIIDIEKCEDCNNCFLACKDEHVDNEWPGYTNAQPRHGHRWINILRKERGQFPLIDVAYRPTPCMHCDDAPCIAADDTHAISKRADGIVMIDPQKAKGQKKLIKTCPYGAIWWNEEKNVPQKCTLCAHLLDAGWKQPRCVQACPTGAMKIVKAEDEAMYQLATRENLEVLSPELNTHPRVYYKNLYRFERCFLAGSVAIVLDGVIDCAQGAMVILKKEDRIIAEIQTDVFGDFKFDKLEPNSGTYELEIAYNDLEKKVISVEVTNSLSIGDIIFE